MMVEISTHVANLQRLRECDLAAYDALYLGDYTCPHIPGNFSSSIGALAEGVKRARALGKRCYLSLPAVPRESNLSRIRTLLLSARALPLDGVEVHSVGLLRVVGECMRDVPIHVGIFGAPYTDATVEVLRQYGVHRIMPSPELSLDEVAELRDLTGVEVLVPVHGKIPLAYLDRCYIAAQPENAGKDCAEICLRQYWLRHNDWVLRNIGHANLSGKDFCLLEHCQSLMRRGFHLFYIQSLRETGEYVARTGEIYREAFLGWDAGTSRAAALEELRGLATIGLCNGYAFGQSGQTYVRADPALACG